MPRLLALALVAVSAIWAQPALASGAGDLPPLVHDIGISLLFAGVLAVLFTRLKIPSVAAFLAAGVIVGPLGLKQVTDPVNIDTIAQLGFILLLFMIGLEINVRDLIKSGRSLVTAGLLQFPLTLLFGLIAAHVLLFLGIGHNLLGDGLAPFYVGAVIAGSSTLQVVKLFQQKFELDTQPGRIALVMLIFQDIWAIVITLLQPNLAQPQVLPILYSFLGIGILTLLAWGISRLVIARAFHWISRLPELILLGAVSWCFGIVALGANLDSIVAMFGVTTHLNVGNGMAALIAGAVVANQPFSVEVTAKVGLVKDFFVTLFFVGLGVSIPAITGWDVPILALALTVFALIARQVVFFPLFAVSGIDPRNSQVASIRLAQISEFGLVIAFLGVQQGHISQDFSSAIILAFVLTALATSPLYDSAYGLYGQMKPVLTKLGFGESAASADSTHAEYDVALLGLHRDASSLLHNIISKQPDIAPRTLVIDFNVSLHPKMRGLGVEVKYGDISNSETLLHAGIERAKIIICTITDDLLRGTNNRDLVASLRAHCPHAIIVANAIELSMVKEVYAAGADYVYMPRLSVAQTLTELVEAALRGGIEDYKDQERQRIGPIEGRSEVLS